VITWRNEVSFVPKEYLRTLGPNGKTSLIRIINKSLCLIAVKSFSMVKTAAKHVQYIGYLPEERLIYKYEVVRMFVFSQMKGLSKEQKQNNWNIGLIA
jgi:ABC-2 type transport system ATP-binding protein